jgi:transcriptional/translational regulatory protein YebC/TACO1
MNSKLFSKYSKQLYVAAKNGVPDPDANPALRSLVERAKRENVPSHVIDKAIQKASGTGGEDYHPARYEGIGPGGAGSAPLRRTPRRSGRGAGRRSSVRGRRVPW